ncbi:SDR family oxidoreductase [Sphingomonas morindae]|uniref:SDR family oxidoreductase n=1 Tax=Sphingomonas morindae TaxID=1541170 RepID=A0ABY4XD77_9SPHN|nr:SDR family oxidoreductase [Sphingomonas morindae]USI74711.1 SDR family oxidoreductase [Sphingomonas morindae]
MTILHQPMPICASNRTNRARLHPARERRSIMKTWFITGASSGLGRDMTEKLLARGDRVAATVRRADALADLAATHGDRLRILTLDVTDTEALRHAIDAAFAALGRIDLVVSNAGYGLFGAAEEVSDAQIARQLATNLLASIQLIRAVLPHLRAQGGGRIVQLSSEGGQIAYPSFSLYHASKWGIEGFVEAVRQEVARFGIDCLLVEPGPTGTNFGASLDIADAMDAYAATPAGDVRRMVADGAFPIRGDAGRTVDAMIAAADAAHPTLRLTLGSAAYRNVERGLSQRLEALRAQRDIAFAADRPE